ncbi:hypothetical protein B4065_2269 [Caldibacillus thermoamylovorans]|uniref:PepSY domain-containing protein n=1 Tax=Caldibacillus thermoamylovorans TaxID=35841 RepID=UPI0005A45E2E|nr:PepSY domain-containing protein [Caldibacillus thermoamylovorans]KIO66725.1 hypothetical protein B4065_2269 [Caldibacillus thermoamylovorans]
MNKKSFLAGIMCGIAFGFLSSKAMTENRSKFSSEEILHLIKNTAGANGKVIGSWIMTKPETLNQNSFTYQAYRGGITKIEDNDEKHFEFLADANTGEILEWSIV